MEERVKFSYKISIYGSFQKIRHFFYCWSINTYFDYFVVFIVVFNAILMALDGDLFDKTVKNELFQMNKFFNAVFILEFVVKIIGLGPISKRINLNFQ